MAKIEQALVVAVAGFCLLMPAWAQDAMPGNDEGRYTFSKVGEGFVRLDAKTGHLSFCGRHAVGWACQTVPEDRAVLESEIARLRSENAALKKEILARGLSLPSGMKPEPPPAREGDRAWSQGGDSALDRMMVFTGRVWHRLVDTIVRAQRYVLNKS